MFVVLFYFILNVQMFIFIRRDFIYYERKLNENFSPFGLFLDNLMSNAQDFKLISLPSSFHQLKICLIISVEV